LELERMTFVREEKVRLEFQNYIDHLPVSNEDMYRQAASADGVTINHWRETWLKNIAANKAKFGSFGDYSLGSIFNKFENLPVIVAGSGPSLKHNAHKLKDRGRMGLVSCLHNFHLMEDVGAGVDLYVSLDSGPVTVEEVHEGGSKSSEEYWAMTKDKTLACYIGSDPVLLEKWQGKIVFFNAPIPDRAIETAVDEIEPFNTYVSSGGNVLGACLYIAKCFLGANPIVFVGADFSFGYEISEKTGKPKFHSWDSKYDVGIGNAVKATDIFGNKISTWPSYYGFKSWFDCITGRVPGIWVNCTEGGLFGAYPDGNLRHIMQMKLTDLFEMYSISSGFRGQAVEPHELDKRVCF
jgi:hypothetical protein